MKGAAVSMQGHGHQERTMPTLTFSKDWLRYIANETVESSIRGTYTNKQGDVIVCQRRIRTCDEQVGALSLFSCF